MDDKLSHDIEQLERQRCKALVARDYAALERLFADSLLYTHSTGRYDTKSSYIEQLRSAQRYTSMRREDVRMRTHGEAVFCTGRVVADIDDGSKWVARYSNVWVRTGEGWQMGLWQATTLPPA